MSEDSTKEMNGRSEFERIMQRFDVIDSRLDSMDEHLRDLDQRVERLEFSTKPIWEQALAAITETRQEMRDGFANLLRRINVMNNELLEVKAEQSRIDKRVDDLERRPS